MTGNMKFHPTCTLLIICRSNESKERIYNAQARTKTIAAKACGSIDSNPWIKHHYYQELISTPYEQHYEGGTNKQVLDHMIFDFCPSSKQAPLALQRHFSCVGRLNNSQNSLAGDLKPHNSTLGCTVSIRPAKKQWKKPTDAEDQSYTM